MAAMENVDKQGRGPGGPMPATREQLFALLEVEQKKLQQQKEVVEGLRRVIFELDQRDELATTSRH